MSDTPQPTIAALVPTFNEQEVLRQAVASLHEQGIPGLTVIAINAGDPLEADIAARVEEVKVPSDYFWTKCIQVGFGIVKERGFDYVLLANADMTLTPGTISLLLEVAKEENVVACCPGYVRLDDGSVRLLYSHEKFYPWLLHARARKAWSTPEEAPKEPFETPVIGGQGVLFKASLLKRFDVDPEHFPQAKGDHDFWLTMKEGGVKIMVVPQAGAVNLRGFGAMQRFSRKKRLQKLWPRATAKTSNDSAWVIWHMRRKHLPLPHAVLAFALIYPWRLFKGFLDAFAKPEGAIDESSKA